MKDKIREYVIITIGFILVSIGIEYFYVPANITAGGATGVSMVLHHYFRFLPLGSIMMVINAVIFILGFLLIGSNFGAKTIYASFGLSGSLWIMEKIWTPHNLTNDLLLASIVGTIIMGLGLGIVFSQNASTGGSDVIAKILNKYFHFDIGKCLQSVDVIVVILGFFTFGIQKALYALICVILNGLIIDKVLEGFTTVKSVAIFSEDSEAVKNYIIKEINRGCTVFEGKGGYTNAPSSVVYSVMDRTQLVKLRGFIKKNFPSAFIIVNESHEVLGQGFQSID